MSDPSWSPRTGGCQCGAVRYEITEPPQTLYLCHCTECQKQSSSAFGMSLTVTRAALRLTRGAPQTWSRTSDSGKELVCSFCGTCGTRLFHARPSAPDAINIKAGSLGDRSWLAPVGHLWLGSAQPWMAELVAHDPTPLKYPAQPPDKAALIKRWRESHGG